jgi:mRNA interferase YafQ
MKSLRLGSAFNKDLKRIERRNYNRALLDSVLDVLRAGEQPPRARRDHPLKGEWKGWRECHVQPDWLLIYRVTDTEVQLGRTGTHADLFGN